MRKCCKHPAEGFYLQMEKTANVNKGPTLQDGVSYGGFDNKLRDFENADKPGSNLWHSNVGSAKGCAAGCRMTKGCAAFTFNSAEKRGPNCMLWRKTTKDMKGAKKFLAGMQ